MGAPDSPVRQLRHQTVRVLTVSTVGDLTSWGTGQSGATPDSPVPHRTGTVQCPVRSDSTAHCCEPLLRLAHRTFRWHTGQSGEL
jgi:hypothetical protein